MIIARVDLRLVVDNRDQLRKILNEIMSMDRAHVPSWSESYYDGRRKPQGGINLEAIDAVSRKLAGSGS